MLFEELKPLYLKAFDHKDGISTILRDNKGKSFCLHSWYSREYDDDPSQRERIDKLFKEVYA